jgi:hypothetical protein
MIGSTTVREVLPKVVTVAKPVAMHATPSSDRWQVQFIVGQEPKTAVKYALYTTTRFTGIYAMIV